MSLPDLSADYARAFPELVRQATPAPTPDPQIVVFNEQLADELGLDAEWLTTPEGINFLLGHQLPGTITPVAQAYAGHQFGAYAPLFGDVLSIFAGELSVNVTSVDF